jgi:cell division ATPase FtsA
VSSCALWNVLTALEAPEKDKVTAFIDLGADKTGIYIFKDGILQFSREIAPAGNDMTRAMMEGIDSKEDPDLIYEQAEKIKKTMGIPFKDSPIKNGDQTINLSKIPFLVRPVLERLVAEVNRSLDYYKNQFHVERFDRLLLTGGGANLKNLPSYLSEELHLSVERFNPLTKMLYDPSQIDPKLLDEIGSVFAAAGGMALPERSGIELLPAQEPILSRARIEKYAPRISILIGLLAFGLIVWVTSGQINRVQKERDEKMAKVKAVEMLQAKLQLLKEKETQIRQDLSVLPSSMIVPVPFREVLGTVSRIVPENGAATLLSVHPKPRAQKGEPQPHEGVELQIRGLVFGNDLHCLTALARIIEGLEESPLLKNVKLVSADEDKSYNQPGIGFKIMCDLELENPPSPSFTKGGLGD